MSTSIIEEKIYCQSGYLDGVYLVSKFCKLLCAWHKVVDIRSKTEILTIISRTYEPGILLQTSYNTSAFLLTITQVGKSFDNFCEILTAFQYIYSFTRFPAK